MTGWQEKNGPRGRHPAVAPKSLPQPTPSTACRPSAKEKSLKASLWSRLRAINNGWLAAFLPLLQVTVPYKSWRRTYDPIVSQTAGSEPAMSNLWAPKSTTGLRKRVAPEWFPRRCARSAGPRFGPPAQAEHSRNRDHDHCCWETANVPPYLSTVGPGKSRQFSMPSSSRLGHGLLPLGRGGVSDWSQLPAAQPNIDSWPGLKTAYPGQALR